MHLRLALEISVTTVIMSFFNGLYPYRWTPAIRSKFISQYIMSQLRDREGIFWAYIALGSRNIVEFQSWADLLFGANSKQNMAEICL